MGSIDFSPELGSEGVLAALAGLAHAQLVEHHVDTRMLSKAGLDALAHERVWNRPERELVHEGRAHRCLLALGPWLEQQH